MIRVRVNKFIVCIIALILICVNPFMDISSTLGAFYPSALCIAFLPPEAACSIVKFFIAEGSGL